MQAQKPQLVLVHLHATVKRLGAQDVSACDERVLHHVSLYHTASCTGKVNGFKCHVAIVELKPVRVAVGLVARCD